MPESVATREESVRNVRIVDHPSTVGTGATALDRHAPPKGCPLGYVTGATVSNPLVFDATGTADIPAIGLAAADGTVALNAQRVSGSPLSDCDTAKTAGVYVQDDTNTGTLLWVKPSAHPRAPAKAATRSPQPAAEPACSRSST